MRRRHTLPPAWRVEHRPQSACFGRGRDRTWCAFDEPPKSYLGTKTTAAGKMIKRKGPPQSMTPELGVSSIDSATRRQRHDPLLPFSDTAADPSRPPRRAITPQVMA